MARATRPSVSTLMPFEIPFLKPTAQLLESNGVWIGRLIRRVPQLSAEIEDRTSFAEELAGDIGLTPEEYLTRGIGLAVELPGDPWIRVSFWEDSARVELPNFPTGGPAAALARANPVVVALLSFGFQLCHPTTGVVSDGATIDLVAAYLERQCHVETVARLIGGTVG